MKMLKKVTAIFIAVTLLLSSFAVNAEENIENQTIKVLFLGNSLEYYNQMDTEIFPSLCESAGKNVEVTSVTESGTTLYRLSSENTGIGKKVLQTLDEGDFDYVILQPSRRVTPFEYSVYHAEYQAALKLNGIINDIGAKTLILASPGLNTGKVGVYTMDSSGVDSTSTYSLPIDRKTHQIFFKNLAYELSREMVNAQVVDLGDAVEYALEAFPNLAFYQSDKRHPSNLGSYLTAACIYSSIFSESVIGVNYIFKLKAVNAVIAQRAAAVAVLGENKDILTAEYCTRAVSAVLKSNTEAQILWEEPKTAEYYNIYRRGSTGDINSYALVGRTVNNECNFIDTTLQSGQKYFYRIKAVHKVGDIEYESAYSGYDIVQTLTKPAAPKLTLIDKNTVTLKLEAVATAEKYLIYRKIYGGEYKLIGSTSTLEYTDKTLKAGNRYYYRIAAKKDSTVVSEQSNYKSIFALNTPKVKLTSSKKNIVKGTITPVKGADLYAIYIKRSGEKKYTLYKTTSKLAFTVKKLKSGKTCYFKFRACKARLSSRTASIYKAYSITVK